MTTELAKSGGNLQLSTASFRQVLEKPLLLLDGRAKESALKVWTCNRHLSGMETPVALAARVAIWINDYDLRPEDAADLLDNLLSPESSAKHRFASDLLADLAQSVTELLKVRRRQEERARQEAADRSLRKELYGELTRGIGEVPQ